MISEIVKIARKFRLILSKISTTDDTRTYFDKEELVEYIINKLKQNHFYVGIKNWNAGEWGDTKLTSLYEKNLKIFLLDVPFDDLDILNNSLDSFVTTGSWSQNDDWTLVHRENDKSTHILVYQAKIHQMVPWLQEYRVKREWEEHDPEEDDELEGIKRKDKALREKLDEKGISYEDWLLNESKYPDLKWE